MNQTDDTHDRSGPHAAAVALDSLRLQAGDRVLVLGGYGVRNVGDEAILSGLLSQLPPGVRVSVVSRSPRETAEMHHVHAVSPLHAMSALARSRALIIGGGGLFSGHMGSFGRLIPLLALCATILGVRVALHGIGVYPSTPAWVQGVLKRLAPRLALFTVRDSVSARLVRSWGAEAQQVPDLSFDMQPASEDAGVHLLRSMGLDPKRPTVALCLTATEPRLRAPLLNSVPEVVNALPETQFCFVPMSHHPHVSHHNDLALAHDLRARAPRIAVLETWRHPAEILALFSQFAVVLGMRYHSLLFGERTGATIVPIPYAEKAESWAEERGLTPTRIESGELLERITQALAQARGEDRRERPT